MADKELSSGTENPGDVGRRVAIARKRLGLSREEVAARAGMAPSYLQYVEEQPADPGVAGLISLAGALETTISQLRGGGIDLPPGEGRAARHPELRELDPQECRARLSRHGVGRVAVSTAEGPAVLPVNYTVVDDAIVFRTAPGTAAAAAVGAEVAFEVDHVDDALSEGWSVLVVGRAGEVTEPQAVRRLTQQAHSRPWAGGERELWVRIEPRRVTGRRILAR